MCHGQRHHRHYASTEAPRVVHTESERRDVRASDSERDRVVEQLRVHAQAGRLTSDELEQRVDQALHAKTRADLDALQKDLPTAPGVTTTWRRADDRHERHHAFIPIAVLLIAIWAVTGAGYFWPVWPLLWFGFIALRRSSHIRVTGNTHRTW